MPTFQSPGISSGLDVNSMVTRLVAVERAPVARRLDRLEGKLNTQLSALGVLKGSLSSLLSSLASLKTESAFQARQASSSDDSRFVATATAAAAAASYSVETVALASAHKITSGEITGGAGAVLGSGTLTIAVGANSFSLTIDGTNNTLAGIRDAINSAVDNKGVTATLVNTAAGAVISLTARDSGAAKALRVTQAGGDGGLAALTYDPGVLTNLTQVSAAADASLRVDGFLVSSPGNSISSAIDGVTINLMSAAPGTVNTLTISNDSSVTVEKVKKFVQDYNTVAAATSQLRRYNSTTREAGPLLGDAMLRGIESTLRNFLSGEVAGAASAYNTLASIGITTQSDGSLKLDDTKLTTALAVSFDTIGKLFGSATGVAAVMHAYLDGQLESSGQLGSRTDSIGTQKRQIQRDRDNLDRRMVAIEQRYRAQFSALDTALAGMQQTSAFLTQRLGTGS